MFANDEKRLRRCCFTGHRPEKLQREESEIKWLLNREIQAAISDGITTFISGMSRGVDLWAAQIVLTMKKENMQLKLISVIPYENFEKNWSANWKKEYWAVRAAADYVKVLAPSYKKGMLSVRNRYMVDHAARIIAVYHGGHGGTYQTLSYARQKHVPIWLLS